MTEPKTDDEPKMILVNKLDPMSEYIPFGKYILSLKQLSKGRFMLRTKSRNPILSFKTIVLTRRTKAIVQKLLQDIDVSFEEVDALNEDERNILNQIVEKTEINTRLRVPNTRRSKLEQKLNKFNVLRGSIIAGNNNENLLRDFRMLLVELNSEGYVSKKETSDILLQMLRMNI